MFPPPGRLPIPEGGLLAAGPGDSILPGEGESEAGTEGTDISGCKLGPVVDGISMAGGGAKLAAGGRLIEKSPPCLELQSSLASLACSGID